MQAAKERCYRDPELRRQYRKRKYQENLRQGKCCTNMRKILNQKGSLKNTNMRKILKKEIRKKKHKKNKNV